MGGEYSHEDANPRMVCWIDDNHFPNNAVIIEALKEKNIRVELFDSTESFISFYTSNQLNDAPFSALRIITDMARKEKVNNVLVEKKTAGIEVLSFLRTNKYQHPILIYQSEKNVPRTVNYLREQKISWVFAESSLAQAREFALFSQNYTPSFPIDESEARPLERFVQNEPKDGQSVNRGDYDRIKVDFKYQVEEIRGYMVKNQISKLKIPTLDKDTVDKLPTKHREWHILLVHELMNHSCFKIGNYSIVLSTLESSKTIPAQLPLYCAVAVRLYSGPNIYRAYLEGIKNGEFEKWTIFTACLETAFYFLPPWKGQVVWRGTNSRVISPFYHEHIKNSDFVFMVIGVTSTSVKKEVAVKFIEPMKSNPTLYKLYTTNGRDISALSEYKTEAEILLPIFSAWVVVETGWIDVEKQGNTIKTRFVQAVQLDSSSVDEEIDIEELIQEGKDKMNRIANK